MKLKHSALAVALILAAGSASAASVDLRLEYRASKEYTKVNKETGAKSRAEADERHQGRVKIGDSFKINSDWKHSTSLEVKFHSDDTVEVKGGVQSNASGANSSQFFKDLYVYEAELDNTATRKLDKNWYLQVGMPINIAWDEPDANDGEWKMKKITYKPQFRVGYKADMGLATSLRLRMEFANFRNYQLYADKNMVTGERLKSPKKMKWTYAGGYKIKALPKFGLSWEGNYTKSLDNVALYDNKDWEWDFGLKFAYKLGDWTPFAEVWSTDVSSSSDAREAKYRLGLKYSF